MQSSSIEWTDMTVNFIRARCKITGKIGWFCIICSPGCANCYAWKWNIFRGNGHHFKATSLKDVEIFLDEKVLQKLLKRRKPAKVFPCDMTDIFGPWVKEEWLDKIFATFAMCRNLTFQVLTKRPERMRDYLRQVSDEKDMQRWAQHACDLTQSPCAELIFEDLNWPLPNLWLGVSVEDRKHGLPRIDVLREIPAAVRFLSIEPLLEDLGELNLDGIDWVIVGGESGPKARPMHPNWARSIRDQCIESKTPFLFKQWGRWGISGQCPNGGMGLKIKHSLWLDDRDGTQGHGVSDLRHHANILDVGKKAAGRLLDGREWSEFPEVATR